jgi:hypothetical protein
MPSTSRRYLVPAVLFLLATLFLAGAVSAQDSVTVGTVTADGPVVDVPVYIRDIGGTPLGIDQPAASHIQAFSIRVSYAPAAAVSSVTFQRAGITARLNPIFETKPVTAGAISLLDSFRQSTDPIPFTLSATRPGDYVAHLVFTLSSSAVPGMDIALTLDPATTQLTDEGGSAATKESVGNGKLALGDGVIHIPVPTLTLTPQTQSIRTGSVGSLTIETSNRLVNSMVVTLTSSNPARATVPSTATIASGSRSTTVSVGGVSAGRATISASLPDSSGGAMATAAVTVTQAPQCPTPGVPQIEGPVTASSGSTYAITWTAVTGATDYFIEEATDVAFTTPTSRTTTATTAEYSHASAGTFYYRVRARNGAGTCDATSLPSSPIAVAVTTVTPLASRFLPVVGSAAGGFGSFFKTSLQLYNPGPASISGNIVLHTAGAAGSAADPSFAYSIPGGNTLSIADLLPAMGLGSGLGSADVIADATSALPVTLARIFNDAGVAGTTGLAFDALPESDALKQGDTGLLFAPADMGKFRLNIGVRSLGNGASMTVTVRDRDGLTVNVLTKTLAQTYFNQTGSAAFLDGMALTGGETISFEVTGGAAFIYGATTDNVTNDPSVQFARRIE